ncbi:MAG: ATP-binding protein [Sphingobium sp.]|nr:ATP-binding protein [Sphingobium sp.]
MVFHARWRASGKCPETIHRQALADSPHGTKSEPVSNSIVIGHEPAGRPATIDIEELLATRLLVQGNSGSGKSHLLRRLLEESAALVQQVVIDPEGDFVTLAEPFGHVVIDAASYASNDLAQLATRIRRHRASVVLALDGLELEAQMRCAALFLSTLFDAPREFWYPALVVVDEAQMFAPAAAGDVTDETRRLSLAAMTNLMCRGRKRGLAGIIATQRLAKLAKNVAAEASNFLMGRTFLDIDMQRAADLLGMERRQAEQIRDLERGHFLALGPAISRRPLAVRISNVQTAPKTTISGLIPRPEAAAEDMFALLHAEPEERERVEKAPPPPSAPPVSSLLAEIAAPPPGEAALEPPAQPALFDEPADHEPALREIIADMVQEADLPFRPIAANYQDFTVRCRMQRIPASAVGIADFRRRLSLALAGFGAEDEEGEHFAELMRIARAVPEEQLAPFLLIARAAIDGAPCPDDDQLARVYGTSSPGRIRRLMEHLEKSGFIVLRTDYGGRRSVGLPGLNLLTAPQEI